jgi:hypothetical protein
LLIFKVMVLPNIIGTLSRLQNPGVTSSSPREERVGRGLRRGAFPTKTHLLSPTLSSNRWRRGRKIAEPSPVS